MKHFLILIAIFLLMACSSDDDNLSNEQNNTIYTLDLDSNTELFKLFVDVYDNQNEIIEQYWFTNDDNAGYYIHGGTKIIIRVENDYDFILTYKLSIYDGDLNDTELIQEDELACASGDCEFEITY